MSTQLKSEPFNYFLSGNFAPVREEHTARGLSVTGRIPEDLNGSFLRIGPNPQFIPDVAEYHWFDGDGMLHGVEFSNGQATYRNRYVRTDGFLKEQAKGSWIWRGIKARMAGPPSAPPEGGLSKNAANTALVEHNGRVYALWEGGEPHEIAIPDLDTIGKVDFNGRLRHAFTAHPKVDAATGEMMTFGYAPMPPFVSYSVVDPSGEIVHTTPISIPKGVMMHDCAITEHYTVFLDMPLTFDIMRAMQGGRVLAWEPTNGTRIGVVPRMGGDRDVKWFDVATGFAFHTANAWEEGDEVVVLASRAETTDVIGAADNMDDGSSESMTGVLYEWRLNMKTGVVTERPLDRNHSDFTRINDQYAGRKSRYIYSARFDSKHGAMFDALLKHDYATGETLVHDFGPGRFGGEGVFAPIQGGTAEDDGYVVTFVWDEKTGSSECVVIDARNFDGEPVARIAIPYRVPFGFHAAWVGAR
jgi:carotenoid cleavage dioxygenase-like enzyme